jgi:hypothetical protein
MTGVGDAAIETGGRGAVTLEAGGDKLRPYGCNNFSRLCHGELTGYIVRRAAFLKAQIGRFAFPGKGGRRQACLSAGRLRPYKGKGKGERRFG